MLRIDNLTYRIGPRVLLDQASATIHPGHRVGMVGRNGTGKTTLLRIITGGLEVDGGSTETPSRWRIGVSTQEAPSGPLSLIDTVLAANGELAALMAEAETATDPHRIADIHARLHDTNAHAAPARAAKILAGLGFDEESQQKPCDDFSGGWRMRVALAALLFSEPDLLLLDEPTNHLDLEASMWLEDYLKRYSGTVLLVSHDRGLLNRVVDEILHLEHGKLKLYQGGYDRFETTRRMQLELNAKAHAKQDIQRAHIQKFVDRFRYKANKAKQAQSRIKMLDRMEPIPETREEGSVTFAFPEPKELAPPLYTADRVDVGYDGQAVLKNLSFRLDADDRVALLGANGNGKSTLIKLLAGRLKPLAGDISKSGKLRIGYFAQHQAEELDLSATPLIELSRKRPRDLDQQLRSQLGRFGFSQERADTKVENLSGGEKARLLFALMTCDKPHILLLDEPTNHLDISSRQALVQALNAFEGAVILVSHDPHIIALTADRFWLVDGGGVEPFEGDLDDYRTLLLGRRGNGRSGGEKNGGAKGPSKKQQRQASADKRRAQSDLKKRLTKAENTVHKLEQKRDDLQQTLADPNLYEGDGGELANIQKKLGRVEKDLQDAENDWAAAQEEWDGAAEQAAEA
ncbi:MAG: ABC-F family ATP-binding cassette domain-containing protein [Rhodospirillales bacterium]|nr:ABC-F family ATP-binding cassette domain-containing protein [Alphaproteobacteria bacterium]MBL6948476.1 ABC-F family ATP-binding cassette domain-containing protein [Rhodospirillales bacterium]